MAVIAGRVGAPSGQAQAARADAVRLLARAGHGPTPQTVTEVLDLGRVEWLARQLRPETLTDRDCEQVLDRLPRAADGGWAGVLVAAQAGLGRAVWSRRQLFERAVDFWSNHFAVPGRPDGVGADRVHFEREVIRRHALGRFSDLLAAAVQHPALLIATDADVSVGRAPNTHLGRLLLEQHTVGLDAGFGEAEVLDSARILTGLSARRSDATALYRPGSHARGRVSVLGFTDPNRSADGRPVLRAYLRHLARHRATAHRVAQRLACWFVADRPPTALVERLARVYLEADTAIAPVLHELFLGAGDAVAEGARTRRPLEAVTAAARALGVRPAGSDGAGITTLYWELAAVGQVPLGCEDPEGYPVTAESWLTPAATLGRWNIVTALASGWYAGLAEPRTEELFARPLPATHGELIAALHQRLHGREPSAADRTSIAAFLQTTPQAPVHADSPGLTWRRNQLVSVVLNSPALMVV